MICLLESFQLLAGIEGTAVTNTANIEYVNTLWIKTLREFLHVNNATRDILELIAIDKKRYMDRPIMTLL